jgi:hypothetical protein
VSASDLGHPAAGRLLYLQRAVGNGGVAAFLDGLRASPVPEVLKAKRGRTLEGGVRAFMESRLGQDFGDVRVHTDALASSSARSVDAHAYTVGTDVVFRGDRYTPHTAAGKRMLAHELVHVMQQRAGPVDGSPGPGGIAVSDPSDRFEQEADRVARQVMEAGPEPDSLTGTAGGEASAGARVPAAQRKKRKKEDGEQDEER